MNIEEINTVELSKRREQLSKKLVEIRELVDTVKAQIDVIGEEENHVWYSMASLHLHEKFLNDYQKFLEFDDSFHNIVQFLEQVSRGYEDLNGQMIDNITKIGDAKIGGI